MSVLNHLSTRPMSMPSVSTLRRYATITCVVVMCLTVLPLYTADAQQVQQITFDQAVSLALENNTSLKRSQNSLEVQSTFVSDRKMVFVPNLNVSTGLNQSYGRNIDPTTNDFVNQVSQSWNGGISTGIPIFTGFRNIANLNQARYDFESADLQLERQKQAVIFSVMSNYLNLLDQRRQVEIQQENLEAQRQQLQRVEEYTRVGTRPISDLYQQQALTAQAELTLINRERAYQLAEINVIQILQLDPFGTYEFVAPEFDEANMQEQPYDVGNLLRQAFSERPDLAAQEASIRADRESIRAARSGTLPSLSMNFNYGSRWSSLAQDAGVGFSDQFDQNRGGGFGFNLSMPLFDRFGTRNNVQRAQVQYENGQLQLEDLRQNIALDVRQAYLDYQTALKQLDVTGVALRSAEQALQVEQERYNVGASTIVELTQVRASFVQASSDRSQAVFEFFFREKLIDYYSGALNPTEALFR